MGRNDKMMQAVIFDMDGVLIDSEPVYLDYMLRFARMKNPEVKPEDIHGIVGRTSRDSWEIMERAIGNGQSWAELRKEYQAWTSVYESMDYRAVFRPEARGLLEELKRRGYHLAVASSTHRQLVLHVLFQNQILSFFDTVVTGDMFTRSKPDPEIYHYTAAKLDVKEENCFVLEDSTAGIRAAHDAGMVVAALIDDRFGFDQSLADHQVRQVQDILRFL